MKITSIISDRARAICAAAFLAPILAAVTAAGYQGAIKTDDNKIIDGDVTYRASKYFVKKGPVQMTFDAARVIDVRIQKPAEWDAIINMVQAKRYDTAVSKLQGIARDYKNLFWDVQATEMLVLIYNEQKKPAQLIEAARALQRSGGAERLTGKILDLYIDALIAQKQTGEVRAMLELQIQKGSRSGAAVAQVKRGDLEMSQGNAKAALRDGYLRTIVLFNDIKEAQPQALFQAAKAFESLGRSPDAEKMRQILLAKYPQSPYSQQVTSGR